jgi:hypothetical protein
MVALTILNQLGGNQFLAMTGAKNLVRSEDALSFSIGRNNSKANRVVITLDEATDTYIISFWKVSPRTGNMAIINEYAGVYCDQLRNIFESTTGLRTSL